MKQSYRGFSRVNAAGLGTLHPEDMVRDPVPINGAHFTGVVRWISD